MNLGTGDWLSRWKAHYPDQMGSWDAQYPKVDREYVTFYPCDVHYLDTSEVLTEPAAEGEEIHLYVHVPFCKSLCPFCFFTKYPFDKDRASTYMEAVKREIACYSRKPYLQNCRVSSIYFGGGTPTVLPPNQIVELLQHLQEYFNVCKDAEITVESSPLTTEEESIRQIARAGVNRVSVGVQSFNESLLQRLHLVHEAQYCERMLRVIKDLGVNVGIDLMYSLPSERLSDWERDLDKAVSLSVDTISCYSLELPPTVKEELFGSTLLPSPEEDIEMYHFAIGYLDSHGYHQYTVADFALPSRESVYVASCWRAPQHQYLSFGPGAHSFIGGFVFYNIASLEYYVEWTQGGKLPILFGKRLATDEAMSRYFVLGVRCLSVSLGEFEQIFGMEATKQYAGVINDLVGKGLVRISEAHLELTRRGLVYVDNISKAFYTPNNRGKSQPVGILLQGAKPTDFPYEVK